MRQLADDPARDFNQHIRVGDAHLPHCYIHWAAWLGGRQERSSPSLWSSNNNDVKRSWSVTQYVDEGRTVAAAAAAASTAAAAAAATATAAS